MIIRHRRVALRQVGSIMATHGIEQRPIYCLDDFEINVTLAQIPQRLAARSRHTIEDWRYEVADQETLRGYEDWLDSKIEQESC